MLINLITCAKKVWYRINKFLNHPKAKIVTIIIILLFLVFYFYSQFDEISQEFNDLSINYDYLALALLMITINTFLSVTNWWLLVSWLGYKTSWVKIVKGYALSTLAKYIPGSIWQYAGRAYFMQEFSIPVRVVGIAIISEYVLITLIGIVLAGISEPFIQIDVFDNAKTLTLIFLTASLFLIILLLTFPKIVKLLMKQMNFDTYKMNDRLFYLAILLCVIGWLIMSFSYWQISKSLGILNLNYPTALFLHSVSFASGNIVLFFPNGLLVREALLLFLGKSYFNETLLVFSSFLFRLLILIGEVITPGIILVISLHQKNQTTLKREK